MQEAAYQQFGLCIAAADLLHIKAALLRCVKLPLQQRNNGLPCISIMLYFLLPIHPIQQSIPGNEAPCRFAAALHDKILWEYLSK